MADYDDNGYSDEEETGAEPAESSGDMTPTESALAGLPVQIRDAVSSAINPPATKEQYDWAKKFLEEPDDLQDRMDALLDARAQVVGGVKTEDGEVVVPGTLQRLKEARARLAGEQYDPRKKKMWAAIGASLGKPGSLGEAASSVAGALGDQYEAQDKYSHEKDADLEKYDTTIDQTKLGIVDRDLAALQQLMKDRQAQKLKAIQYMGKGTGKDTADTVPAAARTDLFKKAGDWFAKERSGAVVNIATTEADAEKAGKVKTGPLYGAISDLSKSDFEFAAGIGNAIKNIKYQDIKELERDVRSVIFPTIRQILGAQFTAKENFALLETAFDPGADPKVNQRRLRAVLLGMKRAFDAKDSYYKYAVEHKGDMSGYTGPRYDETNQADVDNLWDFVKLNAEPGDFTLGAKPAKEEPKFIVDPKNPNAVIANPNAPQTNMFGDKRPPPKPKTPAAKPATPAAPAAPAAAAPPPKVAAPPATDRGFMDSVLGRKPQPRFIVDPKNPNKIIQNPAYQAKAAGGRVGYAEGGKVEAGVKFPNPETGKLIDFPAGTTAQDAADYFNSLVVDEPVRPMDLVGDATAAAAAYGTGQLLSRGRDSIDSRIPRLLGTEKPNPKYMSPGDRRFITRFADHADPEQRLDALRRRHERLQSVNGLPNATALEAMTPEQRSLVNEAIRSEKSTGQGARELEKQLQSNRAAMVGNIATGDTGLTSQAIEAGLVGSRKPYEDEMRRLEETRNLRVDPLYETVRQQPWVDSRKFDLNEFIKGNPLRQEMVRRSNTSWLEKHSGQKPFAIDRLGNHIQFDPVTGMLDEASVPAVYNVDYLDSIKKSLNEMHKNAVKGSQSAHSVEDINRARTNLRNELHGVRPDLAAASDAHRLHSTPIDAQRIGFGDTEDVFWVDSHGNFQHAEPYMSMTPTRAQQYLASISGNTEAIEALRSGVLENLRRQIQDRSGGANPVDKIFGPSDMPNDDVTRIRLLFQDDPAGMEQFFDDMKSHSHSFDIVRDYGSNKIDSARSKPRGADLMSPDAEGLHPVRKIKKIINEAAPSRRFSGEEADELARIAAITRQRDLRRLEEAAGHHLGRGRRAGIAGAALAIPAAIPQVREKAYAWLTGGPEMTDKELDDLAAPSAPQRRPVRDKPGHGGVR